LLITMRRLFSSFPFSRSEAGRIFHLAVPVFFAQLSQMLMGVVDTVMTGQYRTMDMAAVAVATSIWVPMSLFGVGITLALTPLIAHRLGAGDRKSVPHLLRQGVVLALALSVPLIAVSLFFAHNIRWFGLEPELASIAAGFLRAISCGLPGFLLFAAMRGLLDRGRREALPVGADQRLLHAEDALLRLTPEHAAVRLQRTAAAGRVECGHCDR